MINVTYCVDCMARLEDYGEAALSIYELACNYYIDYNEFIDLPCTGKDSWMSDVVSFLEWKKFILATESGLESFKLKPYGHQILTPYVHHFCITPNLHA